MISPFNQKLLLLFLILYINSVYAFEFDHDSCSSLLPNHRQLNPSEISNRHQHERRDADEEDEATYELTPETSNPPFKIEISEKVYRRNRIIKVSIRGEEFNGFILQARSENKSIHGPVGIFKSAPTGATLFKCDKQSDTVINEGAGTKENLEFTWQAPLDDNNNIYFIATIVQKSKFWSNIRSDSMLFNPFPPTIIGCSETKSCYSLSNVDPCLPHKCDYMMIAETTEENEIEFTIGGIVKENSGYIAVGFTMDNNKMSHMDITACIKNGTKVAVQQFLVKDWVNGPRHLHKVTGSEEVDVDEMTIWCRYRRPLHVPGPEMADLRQNLFHTFLIGPINTTSAEPILPPLDNVTFLSEVWNYSNHVNVMHLLGHNNADILRFATVLSVVPLIVSLIFA